MIFNKHSEFKGSHAVFSASQSSWLRYDEDQVINRIHSIYRAALGTEIHEFAASQILLAHKQTSIKNLKDGLETFIFRKYYDKNRESVNDFGQKLLINIRYLHREVFETVKAYINDGIGYKMTTEQILMYSEWFYGTADSISYRDGLLRIHDLKTGAGEADEEQLYVYAALFCLEYKIKPEEIDIELRIYQNGEVRCYRPSPDDIREIMDIVIHDNKIVNSTEREGE